MTSALRELWFARASAGFLRADSICVVTGTVHRVVPNEKRATGMISYCGDCKAGLAVDPKTRAALNQGRELMEMDIREACWMCGGAFSYPRTWDEYEAQACAWCLLASEERKLTTLKDQKTRDVGRSRPFSAHIVT